MNDLCFFLGHTGIKMVLAKTDTSFGPLVPLPKLKVEQTWLPPYKTPCWIFLRSALSSLPFREYLSESGQNEIINPEFTYPTLSLFKIADGRIRSVHPLPSPVSRDLPCLWKPSKLHKDRDAQGSRDNCLWDLKLPCSQEHSSMKSALKQWSTRLQSMVPQKTGLHYLVPVSYFSLIFTLLC